MKSREFSQLIDVSLFLALVPGAFYAGGFAYHQAFYETLNVPSRALIWRSEEIILFGSTPTALILVALVLFSIFFGYFQLLRPTIAKRIAKGGEPIDSNLAFPFGYRLALLFLLAVTLFVFIVKWGHDQGMARALIFLDGDCHYSEISVSSVSDSESATVTGCFVVKNSGFIWYMPLSESGAPSGQPRSIAESQVSSIRISNAVSEPRPERDARQ